MTAQTMPAEPTRYTSTGDESPDGVLVFYDDWQELRAQLTAALAEIERAYQSLELCGVPRERARSVANGIQVFITRTDKERNFNEQALQAALARAEAAEKDAKRYRHGVEHGFPQRIPPACTGSLCNNWYTSVKGNWTIFDTCDQAIDAAIDAMVKP